MKGSALDSRPLAIALMGPTAAGKSALALAWARECAAEIVSVDSVQVYRRLDIGSAKPDAAVRSQVPHHLIDLREPWESYSAAEFARDALHAMRQIAERGRLPLLVGGTGLYFRALLGGLSPMPEAQPALRAAIEAEAAARGWAALHAELAKADPVAAARIEPGDRQRIARALEVWRASGTPISAWRGTRARAPSFETPFPFRMLKLALAPRDRGALHERIAARFDAMLAAGFLEEVEHLRGDPALREAARRGDPPALRAVGYRQAWAHLEGRIDPATFRAQAIAATRQLAKRQITWLRGEADVRWLDPERDLHELECARAAFLTPSYLAGSGPAV